MTELEEKLLDCFNEMTVYKDLQKSNFFSDLKLPAFLRDWVLKKFEDYDGNFDINEIMDFVHEFLPDKEAWKRIQDRIMIEGENVKILTRIVVELNISDNSVSFALPEFGLTKKETVIEPDAWNRYKDLLLKSNESWGVVELGYKQPTTKPKQPGKFKLISFTDFCPYIVDLDYYKELRAEFDIHEWIDVLLGAIDYNADAYASEEQKCAMLTRLLPFVEKRLNLIELAPPGTGKSYVFGSISRYGNLSAGYMTRAKLFYDLSKKQHGIVYNHDFVAFDEVHKLRFQDEKQIGGSLQTIWKTVRSRFRDIPVQLKQA